MEHPRYSRCMSIFYPLLGHETVDNELIASGEVYISIYSCGMMCTGARHGTVQCTKTYRIQHGSIYTHKLDECHSIVYRLHDTSPSALCSRDTNTNRHADWQTEIYAHVHADGVTERPSKQPPACTYIRAIDAPSMARQCSCAYHRYNIWRLTINYYWLLFATRAKALKHGSRQGHVLSFAPCRLHVYRPLWIVSHINYILLTRGIGMWWKWTKLCSDL